MGQFFQNPVFQPDGQAFSIDPVSGLSH